jgi:hypothetical protein
MKIIDPGHKYSLDILDPDGYEQILRFVKRTGENYPGNDSSYSGTNLQEVLRALVDRFKYLDNQIPHPINPLCVSLLRTCLYLLEVRAAQQRGIAFDTEYNTSAIELLNTCPECGHINCKKHYG